MSSDGTSKPPVIKKKKREEKKSKLEETLKTLRAHVAAKAFDSVIENLKIAIPIMQSKGDAENLLKCELDKISHSVSDQDKKQELVFLTAKIKDKAGRTEEALQDFLKIADRNNGALEHALAILEKRFFKIKTLKNVEEFLIKNESSSELDIVLLRGMYALHKIHSSQQVLMLSALPKLEWATVLRDVLVRLRKIPKKFLRIFDVELKASERAPLSPLPKKFFEIVFSVLEESEIDTDLLSGFLVHYKKTELYKAGELLDKVQFLEEKIKRNSEAERVTQESTAGFVEEVEKEVQQFFSNRKSIELDKNTVARLEKEALDENKVSMGQLLAYAEDANFSARPEVFESLGRIYLKVGKFKSNGKDVFEYYGQKGPAKSFAKARKLFEKFYKDRERVGIFSDLGKRYHDGRLFRKNSFLARRILEEGREHEDLDKEGLILLAKMYFWGEGGVEKFTEAESILIRLHDEDQLINEAEALYILAECKYLFYLDAKVNREKLNAEKFWSEAQIFFKRAADAGQKEAAECLRLFEVNDNGEPIEISLQAETSTGREPMEIEVHEEDLQDKNLQDFEEVSDENFEVEKTLTRLCEALRAYNCDEENAEVIKLKAQLIELDSGFANCTPKNFFEKLEQREKDFEQYFDSDLSEDSDSERDQEYHANDKAMSADKQDANKIIKKLRKHTHDCLTILEQSPEDTLTKEYKKRASEFKSEYVPELKTMEVNKTPSMEARRDLETVMDHVGRGDLAAALTQINTPFYVAQTRGIHFFRNKWTREERHEFKRNLFARHHPMLGQPIYSASVYALAEVKERFPDEVLSCLKLRQAARCLSYRLSKLSDLAPHPQNSLPNTLRTDSIKERKYRNRLMQVQQLYSGKYDEFLEDYLFWELSQNPHYFVNQEMHFVSTADLQSKHSSEYALGNKVYPSKEIYRLRPRYGVNQRITRSQMGAVFLTLHPLEDYLPQRNNHIPSLNARGEVELSDEIVSERESTFIGSIPKERLAHIEHMRFPSFHHESYLEVMRLRYGLDKELYDRFKKLLEASKPHEAKNRLTVLLLGEHIAAFKTLWLQKRADKLVRNLSDPETVKKNDDKMGVDFRMKEKDSVKTERSYLLFRTPLGNFSFFPDQPYAGSQKGDDPWLRSRRLQTAYQKKQARDPQKKFSSSSGNMQSQTLSSQPQHVLTLGDGNCAFNAVTLGVCELLALGLLPENGFFDVVLATQLGLPEKTREALVREVAKYEDSELRQQIFQPAIREVAIQYILDKYDLIYAEEYGEHLVQAFDVFNDPQSSSEDEIFCVHEFIKTKFKEDKLSPELLLAWWTTEGKQKYFTELRQSARNTFDKARWGSEIEIDALGKFLGIKISWQSSRMKDFRMIGAHVDEETVSAAFGVYFEGGHWTYVRLPQNLAVEKEDEAVEVENEQSEAGQDILSEVGGGSETGQAEVDADREERRKTSFGK